MRNNVVLFVSKLNDFLPRTYRLIIKHDDGVYLDR